VKEKKKMKKLWSSLTSSSKRSKSSSKTSLKKSHVDREKFEATASLIRTTTSQRDEGASAEMICHLLYDGVIKEILAQIRFGGDEAARVAVKSELLTNVLVCVEKYCASKRKTIVTDSQCAEAVAVVTLLGHACESRVAAFSLWKERSTFLRILSMKRGSSPSHLKTIHLIRKSLCVAMRHLFRNSNASPKSLNTFMSKALGELRRSSHLINSELNSKQAESKITRLGVESEMACMNSIVDLVESNYDHCYESFVKDAGFEHLMFIGIKGLGYLEVSIQGVLKCLLRFLVLPSNSSSSSSSSRGKVIRNTNALNVLFTLTSHYFTPSSGVPSLILSKVRTIIVNSLIEILTYSPDNFESIERLLVSAKIGGSIFEIVIKSLRQIHRPFELVRTTIKMFEFIFTQQQKQHVTTSENLLREIGNLLVVLCTCNNSTEEKEEICNGDHTNVANEICKSLIVLLTFNPDWNACPSLERCGVIGALIAVLGQNAPHAAESKCAKAQAIECANVLAYVARKKKSSCLFSLFEKTSSSPLTPMLTSPELFEYAMEIVRVFCYLFFFT
jgi:hypothetical protein